MCFEIIINELQAMSVTGTKINVFKASIATSNQMIAKASVVPNRFQSAFKFWINYYISSRDNFQKVMWLNTDSLRAWKLSPSGKFTAMRNTKGNDCYNFKYELNLSYFVALFLYLPSIFRSAIEVLIYSKESITFIIKTHVIYFL